MVELLELLLTFKGNYAYLICFLDNVNF